MIHRLTAKVDGPVSRRTQKRGSGLRTVFRGLLLDHNLVGEDEGCGAVCKLHEVHHAVKVAHLAQNSWPFLEASSSLAIANRFE
jgi:hypothetical protein